jgi:hypothetical protein
MIRICCKTGLKPYFVGLFDLIAHCVAGNVKKLATANAMNPKLVMQPARVISEVEVFSPLFITAAFGVQRTRYMRLAFGVELILFAKLFTIRTVDRKH